ncbi:MAG: hypothetical protein ACP5GD_03045 [Candidatus Micrarchaeia archaeon]
MELVLPKALTPKVTIDIKDISGDLEVAKIQLKVINKAAEKFLADFVAPKLNEEFNAPYKLGKVKIS